MGHTFDQALRRQRPDNLCDLEASLVYRALSRAPRAVDKTCLKKAKRIKNNTKVDRSVNLSIYLCIYLPAICYAKVKEFVL